MSRPDPIGNNWSRHNRDWWAARAKDTDLDQWLRVVAVAYSQHGNNGHHHMRRGDLANALTDSGPPPARQRLKEWIDQAVDLGFLAPGSTTMCLVVPPDAVAKGRIGDVPAPCPVHSRRERARSKASAGHAYATDALLKASRPGPDALEQASGDHAGIPDASRSGPISYLPPPQATVSRRAATTEDREASA